MKWFLYHFISVSADGVKHAFCKHLDISCTASCYIIITFIAVPGATFVDVFEDVFFLVIGTPHKPLPEVIIFPCKIKCLFLRVYILFYWEEFWNSYQIIDQGISKYSAHFQILICFDLVITALPSGCCDFIVALIVDVSGFITSGP